MDPPKTPRKRVANFTADEKALLAQLVKNRPIIESKLTDGKSVTKKQAAWELITQEFNSNINVHKRETATLKRAWDNMKAFTRKARATARGSLLRTGGGPQAPPPPPEHGAIINMVEDAAPVMICEIKNTFDSDGAILQSIEKNIFEKKQSITPDLTKTDQLDSNLVFLEEFPIQETDKTTSLEEIENSTDSFDEKHRSVVKTVEHLRRPTDYIRREAATRLKHLENKNKMEMQRLKVQLRAALLEEERNKILLEKAKLELEKTRLEF